MKEKIITIIKKAVGADVAVELSVPEKDGFGHYATNVAMRLAAGGGSPLDRARELAEKIAQTAPAGFFEKVEAAPPGFINLWLSKKTLQEEYGNILRDEQFGRSVHMNGKTVMVEFTDPNPFKLFHIGHLMSNTIGESFARLYEAAGAKVIRANYQGDVGLHIAKAVWGMKTMQMPAEDAPIAEKIAFLGDAYAAGAKAFDDKERPEIKKQIEDVNEAIYRRTDPETNRLYDVGLKWSLAYFETVYARLGTKFDKYFFESEMAEKGLAVVHAHPDIFKESDGAIIFRGEDHGLHTRVFVNSRGLPTYEAKELGLNKEKFELYPLDLSIIVTGSEIIDYFKVLLKALALVAPDVAAKTQHVPHGMLRFASGKMSSRTGDVITMDSLLAQAKEKMRAHIKDTEGMNDAAREEIAETVAVGAVKYSILKQNPGQDIIFDFEKSLSFDGDSGPYVQYTYARLASILRKAGGAGNAGGASGAGLDSEVELALIRRMLEFPDVISYAAEQHLPSGLVAYLYKLASLGNKFYETTPILKDEDAARRAVRLDLIRAVSKILQRGLLLLGIRTLETI